MLKEPQWIFQDGLKELHVGSEILVLFLDFVDIGLLQKAESLALKSGKKLHVAVSKGKADTCMNADTVSFLDFVNSNPSETDVADVLFGVIKKKWNPDIILAPATLFTRNVMSVLAGKLVAGLTADCTDLRIENNELVQMRPAYGNKLYAEIRTKSKPVMSTVRPGVFLRKYIKPTKHAKILDEIKIESSKRVIWLNTSKNSDGHLLTQAKVIISGGAGICSEQGFQKLKKFALSIGAALGASRRAVELGYAPYNLQIGQTGITVHPDVYIAVGISGAVQHIAGISGSKKIVAINNDPSAPIFDYADYGFIGDWEDEIDALSAQMNKF